MRMCTTAATAIIITIITWVMNRTCWCTSIASISSTVSRQACNLPSWRILFGLKVWSRSATAAATFIIIINSSSSVSTI